LGHKFNIVTTFVVSFAFVRSKRFLQKLYTLSLLFRYRYKDSR
jgi:hypothetical protein